MNIAISQRQITLPNGMKADCLESAYTEYLQRFDIQLIPISNSCNVKEFFKKVKINGIILSGGNDVNPVLYKQKPLHEANSISKERDHVELQLIKFALRNKLPILGICRGAQFINVYFGGSLVQNIISQMPHARNHVKQSNTIHIVDDTFNKLVGKKSLTMTCYHNQGITKNTLSPQLRTLALSEDNLIEALYHPHYPIVGIMWHPERNVQEKKSNDVIVKSFLERKNFWKITK